MKGAECGQYHRGMEATIVFKIVVLAALVVAVALYYFMYR
jgi:hypothetical protein